MSGALAIAAPRLFDGETWHGNAALIIRRRHRRGDRRAGPCARRCQTLSNSRTGLIAPGFVDLQVNGGGGVMLNDRQDVDAIRTICRAHAPFGTTALLATLITDTPETTARAVEAGGRGCDTGRPGLPRPASRRPASVEEPQGRA